MYAAEDDGEATEDATEGAAARPSIGLPVATVLVVCVAMTIWIGVLPTIIIGFARDASLII